MKKIIYFLFVFISINTYGQQFSSDNSQLNDAFKLAIQTMDINTRRGILAAGGDYGGEWTRDIAINSWTAASMLRPKVAEKSLWSVTINKDTIGHQYWDKIIWSIAACNHYLITGDKTFLAQAYKCSANTMKQLEQLTFDSRYGLFMGPSVFNDGIAAYPEPIFEPNNHLSGALDHKGSYRIKCLSTNCVYYGAYVALSQMSNFLNENEAVTKIYQSKAEILKKNILKNFYNSNNNTFNYLMDQNGKLDNSQEALGISFAVMFGIIDGEKAKQLIENAVTSNYGITSISPDFPRYSKDQPGRHNNIIWPMVNGFFAEAAIVTKNYRTFNHELIGLTHLALDEDKGDYDFREIYNPYSGKPDGGYQDWGPDSLNFHWQSSRLQTWSATAYISMVTNGLFGMKFNEKSVSFNPFLPDEIGFIELKNLVYRDSKLNISVKGKGNTIASFILDGKKLPTNIIPATIKGNHNVAIILK
jgi:hypothetical protein